ncbi:Guanine nucleotide-binding protein alpha-2 subunit, partial [Kappamyces sp. JEL0680]
PLTADILKLRTVTQSVSDTVFQVDGQKVHFIDVSGLKHHRKSWLSYFDCVNSILYVVSLSSFDQVLVEDSSVNRMADALVLFESIVNHRLLLSIDIMIFFNKKDLFEIKAKKVSIKTFFPEYQGIGRQLTARKRIQRVAVGRVP